MDFDFRKMDKKDGKIVMEYRQEFLKENDVIKGTKHLEKYDNFQDYCNNLKVAKTGEPEISQYLYIRKSDDKLIGMAIIRHELKESNENIGGHIGLGIRPSERKKGYGDLMLKQAIKVCSKMGIKTILMTCNKKNLPSIKNIKKNGGEYDGDIKSADGKITERYWIDLKGEEKMKKVDTNLFKVLKERGLLYQCTDEEALKKVLESGKPIALYEGTDPTVDSLHIGHCVPYCILRRFQQAGHKVVLLMGGATASIGDPTGKSEMRKVLDKETIDKNIENIKNSLKVFLNFDGDNPAIIVNNKDWFTGYDYVDFMRDIGRHFNVNKMLANEIYANRIKEGGLTLFELGYMPMQAYDFIHLNKEHNCTLEWGGADQWGNIVAGVELARKLNFENGTNLNLIGATNPLLLTPEGKKMGKTEKGAIWIDKDKISAYDFYQGVYQTPDACVEMMFALFTDIPMDEIKAMIKEDIVKAKKRLSYELTKFVRGEEDAKIAEKASEALFSGSGNLDNVPTCHISLPMNLTDALFESKLVSSKSEGRRMCQQGAISINGRVEKDFAYELTESDFENGVCILKKGKKNFMKLEK